AKTRERAPRRTDSARRPRGCGAMAGPFAPPGVPSLSAGRRVAGMKPRVVPWSRRFKGHDASSIIGIIATGLYFPGGSAPVLRKIGRLPARCLRQLVAVVSHDQSKDDAVG